VFEGADLAIALAVMVNLDSEVAVVAASFAAAPG